MKVFESVIGCGSAIVVLAALLLGYICVAGRVWRDFRDAWEPLDWSFFDEFVVMVGMVLAVVAWPAWLTLKYTGLGIATVFRVGVWRIIRLVFVVPVVAAWRAGTGDATPAAAELPEARVVRRRRDDEINAGNFEQGCP